MRRNNIEMRLLSSSNQNNINNVIRFEIVKWQPNHYYGRENEFILYDANDEFYVDPIHNFKIHKNCFKNHETCFTLMFINNNGTINFICNRPLELNDVTEYIDMLFLMRKGIKKTTKNNKIK